MTARQDKARLVASLNTLVTGIAWSLEYDGAGLDEVLAQYAAATGGVRASLLFALRAAVDRCISAGNEQLRVQATSALWVLLAQYRDDLVHGFASRDAGSHQGESW